MSESGDTVRLFDVTDPTHAPEGHTAYKITLRVFSKNSGTNLTDSEIIVWKRFSNFQQLRKQLVDVYKKRSEDPRDFPPFVKARYFDRFDERVIEERRVAALQLLQFAASQSILSESEPLLKFLEGGKVVKRGGSESLTSIESGMEEIGRRDVDEVSLPELPRIDLNDAPGSDSNNDDLIPTHPRTLTDASILSSVTTGSIDTVERRDNSASDASKQNLFLSDSMDSLQRETVPLAVGGGDDVDIDMPSLPSLLINEAGDVTVWGSPKGSGTPGRIVSPLGGTWLHKQPSEVTSLASDNEGNEGEEEERAGSASPVEEDTGSRLSPVETPLLTSDIVDVSSEPPAATTAESRDVTGLDAGDSWWQKALSTTDHELTDVLDEMEKNEESDACKETETIEGDHPQSSDSPKKDEEVDGGANLLFDDLTANSKGEKMDPKITPLQLPKVDYVTQSSQLIRDAIDSEMQQDFRRAFDLYKQGVDMLLGGVQEDPSDIRRQMVKRKTNQYLKRAEVIQRHFLLNESEVSLDDDSDAKIIASVDELDSSSSTVKTPPKYSASLRLHDFKVLGLIDKVQLVQNKRTDDVYVIKGLHKLYNPTASLRRQKRNPKETRRSRNRAAFQCPHMVKVFGHCETSGAVYVLLEHVTNGRLTDHLKSVREEAKSRAVEPPATATKDGDGTDTRYCPGIAGINPNEKLKPPPPQGISDEQIARWVAQVVVCLTQLHMNGLVWRDLHPGNLLLNDRGDVVLTHFGSWDNIDRTIQETAVENLYVAPELIGMPVATPAADWWSVGVILFELLTGARFKDCHPDGVHSHLPLSIPVELSPAAKSLIEELIQLNAQERLGSRCAGVEEIMSHAFFTSVEWDDL
ncbi:ribosomal protein S6 kinase delta-1-like isoform X2 [Oscarella lobularis]|uniref:ribosomal protein S6 kinase delta-1-like isoform X2 n=1 Tax=Oscarella lobularis TaxID=121494 RepID=UPI003313D307